MTGAITIEPFYHSLRMEETGDRLIALLQRRDEAAFEQVFKAHYKNLHAYAFTMLKDEIAAEEIVQTIFYRIWERAEGLTISGSITAYLYRAVHNEALNYLKHLKVRAQHQLHVSHSMNKETENASRKLQLKELEAKLQKALNQLPEQCRTIFQLSRFEELRYREIADRLGLSIKTVENQMGKALKILRTQLIDYLPLIVLFINLINPGH